MAWRLTPFTILVFLAAAVVFVQAAHAWRRDEPIARPMAALLTLMGLWALLDGIRLGFTTLEPQLALDQVALAVGASIPVAWLVFTATYAGYGDWLTRRRVALLAAEPAAFALLLATNSYHHLAWSSVVLAREPIPHVVLALEEGYLLHISVAYVLMGVGMVLLFTVFWESSRIYRRQTGLLLFGALVSVSANVSYTLGLRLFGGLDLTTLSFTFAGIVFGIALFRFDLLNLTPVARAQLISTLGTGLVVVNTDDRILHANDVGKRVFGDLAVGASLPASLDVDAVEELDGTVRSHEGGDTRRQYDVHVSEMFDFRDRFVGRLVALQDVTERREYEQRLEVANRLLRHNLRNDSTKLLGWADLIAERTDDAEVARYAERIHTTAWRLGGLSERARYIDETLARPRAETAAVDICAVLEEVVAAIEAEWPSAEVTVGGPEQALAQAPTRELLETAVRNVLENAVEHNDADPQRVVIEVRHERDDDREQVVLAVADNGPGIPDLERRTLKEGAEQPLQHSQGLGLWLTYWIVTAAGGRLDIEENQPRGSVVRLAFPRSTAVGR